MTVVTRLDRQALFDDTTLRGAAWCRAHSDVVDLWLARIVEEALNGTTTAGIALVAVGGYGRAELAPESDIDVVLVHSNRKDIDELAQKIWYPIWDQGLKLGHSVRTTKEALALAQDDLDTATALLSLRHLAGDPSLSAVLLKGARTQWRTQPKRWLGQLAQRVQERHETAGEVAFLLEPDLKEGHGGLRDAHTLRWVEMAGRAMTDRDSSAIDAAYAEVLDARVELHRTTKRRGDVLRLQEQDAVAAALGKESADTLMADLAAAGRTIAWTSDTTWRRVSATRRWLGRFGSREREVEPGLSLRNGEIHVMSSAELVSDPALPLRAASLAAASDTMIDNESLEQLTAEAVRFDDPWPPDARALLADLLLAGPDAIAVIESLDQHGVWVRILPEWANVRSKPQRNAYHRFTVDRHLIEAAVTAAAFADRVGRPDLLVIGTLLHDIGKGFPGDHTEVGIELVRDIGTRMGFPSNDVDLLVAMVQHHLLLPDVATRRDIDDPDTIERVAATIGSLQLLELLAALTEADSLATGPAAWGPWKARLVAQLVERVGHVLGGGAIAELETEEFPTPEQAALMREGRRIIEADGNELTVIAPDRPGLFSRVAGVLTIHGLGVLSANAYSSEDGTALNRFRVDSLFGTAPKWDRVIFDLDAALDGRLALSARVEEKARTYARSAASAIPATTRVTIDNGASADSTVVDVLAADALGVLFRVTRALAELDLDIRSARVETLGAQVVDAFYVRDVNGRKVVDEVHLGEIERAVVFAVHASR